MSIEKASLRGLAKAIKPSEPNMSAALRAIDYLRSCGVDVDLLTEIEARDTLRGFCAGVRRTKEYGLHYMTVQMHDALNTLEAIEMLLGGRLEPYSVSPITSRLPEIT